MKEYQHSLVAFGTFRGCSLIIPPILKPAALYWYESHGCGGRWGRPGRHREIERNVINVKKYVDEQQRQSILKVAFQFLYRNVTSWFNVLGSFRWIFISCVHIHLHLLLSRVTDCP